MFGKSQLRNVAVADSRGVFLTSPEIKLDWTPGAWLYNRLSIDSLTAERVDADPPAQAQAEHQEGPDPARLRHSHRRTSHRPARHRRGGRRPAAERQRCAARPTSAPAGRWSSLQPRSTGGDRIALHLDAEPDRDKFDLAARVIAPANGLVPAMIGTRRPINLDIGGNGQLDALARNRGARPSGRPTARLALGVDSGRYRLQGKWAPGAVPQGKLQRLTAPRDRRSAAMRRSRTAFSTGS